MKKLFFLLALFCFCLGTSAQELATRSAAFQWTYDATELQYLSSFKLYVILQGATNAQPILKLDVPATNSITTVNALTVFGGLTNGVYGVYATAASLDNIESDPTEVLWVFWYGRPSKPGKIVFVTTP